MSSTKPQLHDHLLQNCFITAPQHLFKLSLHHSGWRCMLVRVSRCLLANRPKFIVSRSLLIKNPLPTHLSDCSNNINFLKREYTSNLKKIYRIICNIAQLYFTLQYCFRIDCFSTSTLNSRYAFIKFHVSRHCRRRDIGMLNLFWKIVTIKYI